VSDSLQRLVANRPATTTSDGSSDNANQQARKEAFADELGVDH
jgi:hypothetical protein